MKAPTIAADTLRRMVHVAAGQGLDPQPLWEIAGVAPRSAGDDALDPTDQVDQANMFALIEAIMRAHGQPDMAITLAAPIDPDSYGAIGLALKCAPTTRSSIGRLLRFHRLWTTSSEYVLHEHSETAELEFRREGPRRLGIRVASETALAEALTVMRAIIRAPVPLTGVTLRHARPKGNLDAHAEFFGVQPTFEARRDALVFRREFLEHPLPLADAAMSAFVQRALETKLADRDRDQSLEDRVADIVVAELPDGPPKMQQVARRLAVSPRTLARRLERDGVSFQAIVDDTRQSIACRLLGHPSTSIEEIALLTGFSEASAFSRAFKRWNGVSPQQFRRDRIAGTS